MKIMVCLSLLLLLSGCATTQYIPSKHVVYKQTKIVDDELFSYYQKQINNDAQDVYLFANSTQALHGIMTLKQERFDFELYYELDDEIDISEVMSYVRSLSPQRYRMYYGNSHDFGMLKLETINQQEHLMAIDQVKQMIDKNMKTITTPEEQIRYVHDYLIANTKYDVKLADDGNLTQENPSLTVYGTLNYHLAVCEGYARTFQVFMQELGIPSLIIESQTMKHAWNYVKLNGEWLFVDVTYDDPVPDTRKIRQDYLLLSEKQLAAKGTHVFDDEVSGVSLEQYTLLADFLFPNQ